MESVIDYYSGFDEWGRLDREPLEFTINWHYIKQYLPPSGKVLDNGAGPGKYAMRLAEHGYDVTLTDLTPKLVELARQRAAEQNMTDRFDGFRVLNATCLEGIPDEAFDASLMLGPLYHLQQPDDRTAAVHELHRVTKRDGLVFVAFQSRTRMMLTSLRFPQQWKPLDTIKAISHFKESGIFNHADKGRFTGAYYYNIEDIRPFMESHGFETVDLIGSSGIAPLLTDEQKQYWAERGQSDRLQELLFETARDPSILGISSHLLYIGRRRGI
ncbi:class I SAM-dependent methyltransferase [Paenibacillus hodogayensis]|uniref:Class I SAM-dependent methyltransferase n=1 Tax=Paenibacillus hodogayensis TaxID=279208 RepID=A0ABV5W3U9_9BACL